MVIKEAKIGTLIFMCIICIPGAFVGALLAFLEDAILYIIIGYTLLFVSPILLITTIIKLSRSPTQDQTKKTKKKNLQKEIKAIVMSYPRISMKDMAELLGEPMMETEKTVLMMISRGKIKGHIDPGTKDIISGMVKQSDVIGNTQDNLTCAHCGAPLESIPVKGTSMKCPSCGNLIIVKD